MTDPNRQMSSGETDGADGAAQGGDEPAWTSPVAHRVRHGATPNRIDEDGRNFAAFLCLIAGICAWVPLVIVVAAPLAVGFFLYALWQARRRDRRRGMQAAWIGLGLTAIAAALHLTVAATAGAVGWIGELVFGS